MKIIILLIVLVFSVKISAGQEMASDIRKTTLDLSFVKKPDGTIILSAYLESKLKDSTIILSKQKIKFSAGTFGQVDLGYAVTDLKGYAHCTIPQIMKFKTDSVGKYHYFARFDATSQYEEATAGLSFKPIILNLTFGADSVKTITVKAHIPGADVADSLLKGIPIKIYVPRMFSYLKIADGELDASASASFDFPHNLPGDSIGNLMIIAKIEENDKYGNVEFGEIKKWGIPATKKVLTEHRALWSEIAPVWMIITLTVLLSGVWGHYTFVIIKLIIISKKGKTIIETNQLKKEES